MERQLMVDGLNKVSWQLAEVALRQPRRLEAFMCEALGLDSDLHRSTLLRRGIWQGCGWRLVATATSTLTALTETAAAREGVRACEAAADDDVLAEVIKVFLTLPAAAPVSMQAHVWRDQRGLKHRIKRAGRFAQRRCPPSIPTPHRRSNPRLPDADEALMTPKG